MSTTRTPNLARALMASQRALRSVPRDGRNEQDGYDFTKSDTMIRQCREALLSCGLVVRRAGAEIAPDRSKTVSRFEIIHADSGEATCETFEFPICYSGDRADDKAAAASLTTAWGYWLRDQLALERHDNNEMDARQGAPQKAPAPAAHTPPTPPSANTLFDGRNSAHLDRAEEWFERFRVKSPASKAYKLRRIEGMTMHEAERWIETDQREFRSKGRHVFPVR